MKITKQLSIGLVLVLSSCMLAPADGSPEATTAPETSPAVLQNSPEVSPTGATRVQPSEPPERVEFTHGTDSAQFSGLLPSGLSIKQYVLAAKEGQILSVNFASEDVPVSLSLTSPGGLLLFSEILQADGSSSGSNRHTLVDSGDYLITLTKADHTPSARYTVEFSIR